MQEIYLAPVKLTTETTEGNSAWFSVADLTVPKGAIPGIKGLTIIATDSTGVEGERVVEIEVTNFDEVGYPPEIDSGQSYTIPNIANNDETTKISLYAFIIDEDEDLDYVMINLGNVARYVG